MQGHLKLWLWRFASLLWAEHKFNCGITGLRKAKKMSITILVLVVFTSSTDDTIRAVADNFACTLLRRCGQRSTTTQMCAKGRNCWRILGVWLWHWDQSPIISMEASRTRPRKHVKFGQMKKFCSMFSSIVIAWCIRNSCHKVVRSIRNTTFKLCADSAKHIVINVQNCGKTYHEFCTIITHRLTLRCLYLSFWPKNKTVIKP